jgi:hypothetical protein
VQEGRLCREWGVRAAVVSLRCAVSSTLRATTSALLCVVALLLVASQSHGSASAGEPGDSGRERRRRRPCRVCVCGVRTARCRPLRPLQGRELLRSLPPGAALELRSQGSLRVCRGLCTALVVCECACVCLHHTTVASCTIGCWASCCLHRAKSGARSSGGDDAAMPVALAAKLDVVFPEFDVEYDPEPSAAERKRTLEDSVKHLIAKGEEGVVDADIAKAIEDEPVSKDVDQVPTACVCFGPLGLATLLGIYRADIRGVHASDCLQAWAVLAVRQLRALFSPSHALSLSLSLSPSLSATLPPCLVHTDCGRCNVAGTVAGRTAPLCLHVLRTRRHPPAACLRAVVAPRASLRCRCVSACGVRGASLVRY